MNMQYQLGQAGARMAWECRRLAARGLALAGWAGVAAAVCAVLAAGAWHSRQQAAVQLAQLQARQQDKPPVPLVQVPVDDARSRLHAFDSALKPVQEAPQVVEDLLALAAAEGLVLQRGQYRLQDDSAGSFTRYRLSLPVVGTAPAVNNFVAAALRRHRMLALEALQYKRQQSDSLQLETRMEWVLLVQAPAGGVR
ncbi:hypothetical protein ASD58_29370 [Duganella sp. Root1480D1]|nr:hypothetical protein ASD58_29370 [Duganella sp. Root1480D1]